MRFIIQQYVFHRFKGQWRQPLDHVKIAIVDQLTIDLWEQAGSDVCRIARVGDYWIEAGQECELVRIREDGTARRIWPTPLEIEI